MSQRSAMIVEEGLEGLRRVPPGAVLSIGNFDGIHLGHQRLIERMRELQRGMAGAGLVVVTFEPHPLTVLRPQLAPPRLTPPAIKRALLESAGVDCLVVLPPTPEVLNVSAETFWQILRDDVRPSHLVEGDSFSFGKGRGGNVERLREWSAQSSITLHVIEGVEVSLMDRLIAPVSSSLVRWLLAYGRVRDAAICLGRPYALRGEVIRGYQRGRTLGIPTANLRMDDQLIPADGVYAGRCIVAGRPHPAAVSIGMMPTFGQDLQRQVEAHLLDFDGDLYGQSLTVDLLDWMRDQRKFADVETLKRKMADDLLRIRDTCAGSAGS